MLTDRPACCSALAVTAGVRSRNGPFDVVFALRWRKGVCCYSRLNRWEWGGVGGWGGGFDVTVVSKGWGFGGEGWGGVRGV